jgi:hypothetical protein
VTGPRRGRVIAVVALVGLVAAGCGGDDEPADADADTAAATTDGGTTAPPPDDTDDTSPTEVTPSPTGDTGGTTAPVETFPTVMTTVVGAAVGGSAGSVGPDSTDPFSEAVRNEDGTCSGWAGPGGAWTQGLESGAPVVFLARDSDTQIGTGAIGTSRFEDVGSDREQWNCIFPFEGTIEGTPESYRIKVADLPPWVVVPNAADPSQWIVSIDTTVQLDSFTECASPGDGLTAVAAWDSVGTYWSRGIPEQICGSGLAVAGVERSCRPSGIASEHILEVTRADDPAVVLEDASGRLVDPAALAPGTEVIVHIATGRPCG